MIYVGDDWAEARHDICIIDEADGIFAVGSRQLLIAILLQRANDAAPRFALDRDPPERVLCQYGYGGWAD